VQENERLRSAMTCKKCKIAGVETLFLPCRHLVSCEKCASSMENCVTCNEKILGIDLSIRLGLGLGPGLGLGLCLGLGIGLGKPRLNISIVIGRIRSWHLRHVLMLCHSECIRST